MSLSEQAAALFSITLSPQQIEQFATYERLLVEWNAHTNLTAIIDPQGVEVRHFLDSLSVIQAFTPRAGQKIIDVGTGAGFPGLPLAIAFPLLHVTLMEATGKKVTFLEHIVSALALPNCAVVHARAEEAGQNPKYRAGYDVVLARAVARLPGLVEYMLPLAKVGGLLVAMKGTTAQAEAADAKKALSILGGQFKAIISVTLPGVEESHALVIMEKTIATPAAYPRKPGTPTRKPL